MSEDLLIRRTDTHGSDYVGQDPAQGLGATILRMHDNGSGAWNSSTTSRSQARTWPCPGYYPPEKTAVSGALLSDKEQEAAGMVVHEKHRASVEMGLPLGRVDRGFASPGCSRGGYRASYPQLDRTMKRPDIRMAWREKLASS